MTIRQIVSQKGIRLRLIRSREVLDGTVVELLAGMDYVRAANTQDHEVSHVAHVAEKRCGREIRHHFQMSLFGCAKALNEGFSISSSLSLSIWPGRPWRDQLWRHPDVFDPVHERHVAP